VGLSAEKLIIKFAKMKLYKLLDYFLVPRELFAAKKTELIWSQWDEASVILHKEANFLISRS
jgi:hypothetical protein